MSMLDWVLTIGLSVALVVYLKLVVKLNFECPECELSYTNWMHEEKLTRIVARVE